VNVGSAVGLLIVELIQAVKSIRWQCGHYIKFLMIILLVFLLTAEYCKQSTAERTSSLCMRQMSALVVFYCLSIRTWYHI